jgi:hypothetical protein
MIIATVTRMALQHKTRQVIAAQKAFEQAISHLTPQRQTELLVIRQMGLESARKRRIR